MLKLRQTFATLLKGILAGLCIGLGSTLYLVVGYENKIVASFVFTVGMILVLNFGYFLFTGKIIYLFNHLKRTSNLHYSLQLLIGLVGNLIGAGVLGLIVSAVSEYVEYKVVVDGIKTTITGYLNMLDAKTIVENKLSNPLWVTFLLAMGCNILIYFAVEGFAKVENYFVKHLIVMLCIAGFVILGFEHLIANMFYIGVAGIFNFDVIVFMIVVLLGNTVGVLLIPSVVKLIKALERR